MGRIRAWLPSELAFEVRHALRALAARPRHLTLCVLLLGLGLALTADRPASSPVAVQAAFWGQNVGLLVFMAGLITETQVLKQIGAPVMGISILVALALLVLRLRASSLAPAEPGPAGSVATATA